MVLGFTGGITLTTGTNGNSVSTGVTTAFSGTFSTLGKGCLSLLRDLDRMIAF